MSRAALSMVVFGLYLSLAGAILFAVPNQFLSAIDSLPVIEFPQAMDFWVRVAGLLTFILGFYFLYSVRHKDTRFYLATVYARLIFFTGTGLLVLQGAPPWLLLFGLVDLAGAAWTWSALKM